MDKKEIEEQVIRNYQQDEDMMILVFAQWCVNRELDPIELYAQAYPYQEDNDALQRAIDLTVPKQEAGEISNETVLNVLSLYDNEELASVVYEQINGST